MVVFGARTQSMQYTCIYLLLQLFPILFLGQELFCFKGRILDLIVLVPDHCLSSTFTDVMLPISVYVFPNFRR